MEVGQQVLYVPHVCHALHKDLNKDYPWVIGRKTVKMVDGEQVEQVEELEGRNLEIFLHATMSAPDRKEAMKRVAFVRPKQLWPAKITAIHDDGTVDLDVQSNQGGVTLHYPKVPVSDVKEAHSCHVGGA